VKEDEKLVSKERFANEERDERAAVSTGIREQLGDESIHFSKLVILE
jgi:hypothetical protein